MSEQVLRALMQLFALIAKQDAGVEENEKIYVRNFLSQQIGDQNTEEYYSLFEEQVAPAKDQKDAGKLTSVIDSVKILGICRKINRTLTQNQKIVVLVRLYELVNADKKFTEQRMSIISTVAEVFKITKEESESIERFVFSEKPEETDHPAILVIDDKAGRYYGRSRHLQTEKLHRFIFILRIPSVDLYFFRYPGNEEILLNGLAIKKNRIYIFAPGSAVKLPKGKPIYYSDVSSHFLTEQTEIRLSCQVENIRLTFPNGTVGLREISFQEEQGGLIGILGASGSGKTTLLNVLSGIAKPDKGKVLVNGIDLHRSPEPLEGVIGLIPQDDLLIEELTVYQNLYYNAKLCFKDLSEEEIIKRVNRTLVSLGLAELRDLKVGSPMNKIISGGQRKRLNIALELIREPSILFVDEPTSGLSSSDSENVMDLLRELSLKGKLIFVVIHQPSSEIFKMFDRVIVLDIGGYMIYYGNPVEAVIYFKQMDQQVNSEVGECPLCGNVNPELIFNIIEARVVDEFGKYTEERKVSPKKWHRRFLEYFKPEKVETVKEDPPRGLNIPGWFKQFGIFTVRDFLSKISNRQYVILTLLEAPILGLILSYIIRYTADPMSDTYIFRENENIPIYIFMSLIVALFLGLTVSAEEIFKDRKILRREAFLNLSRSGYLLSKVLILLLISAIQAVTFVLIGNSILEIKGMWLIYWFALFSTAACANMIGLNVSSAFNSAITIYIIIPLLMIPMMVLSGAMFSFDKLNRSIGSVDQVPWVAEIMPTKWSYEALMVKQFKDNEFEKMFFQVDQLESNADFKQVYLIPELQERVSLVREELQTKGEIEKTEDALATLRNELKKEVTWVPSLPFEQLDQLTPEKLNARVLNRVENHLDKLKKHYATEFFKANRRAEQITRRLLEEDAGRFRQIKDDYYNESLADHVRKVFEKNKILEYKNELIRQIEPIYRDPYPSGPLSFRSHFFAPRKYFLGQYSDTYWFNMGILWFLTLIFYITLYFDLLRKLVNWDFSSLSGIFK